MAKGEQAGPRLAATAGAVTGADGGHESGPCARRARVLVADDDDDLRAALRELLTGEGYDVVEASGGADALELLSRAADRGVPVLDVLLLDFLMPGFSGLGILRVARRFSRMPPTILMTGFPDPSVETFARNFGAVAVLRKPVDAARLVAVVRECVSPPGPRSAAASTPRSGRFGNRKLARLP